MHDESHGNADLVAHFFRRAFDLFERMAPSVSSRPTRSLKGHSRDGLALDLQAWRRDLRAQQAGQVAGLAAVVVSVLHVMKGAFSGPKRLDGREVETITASSSIAAARRPGPPCGQCGKSFQGSYRPRHGLHLRRHGQEGCRHRPLAEMRRLIQKDPRNQEVIFPYIGGEEVNTSPTHAHHRYVINFGERSEEECRRRWPDLMAIVEAKVKPERKAAEPDRGA